MKKPTHETIFRTKTGKLDWVAISVMSLWVIMLIGMWGYALYKADKTQIEASLGLTILTIMMISYLGSDKE